MFSQCKSIPLNQVLAVPIPNQLNVLNARPGVVEASLRIEPYNGEFFILAYSPLLTSPLTSKVNRVGVRLQYPAQHIPPSH